MKRIIIALVIALASLADTFAQDVIYVYRNDGEFNAFFKEEVDSITYSNFDLDGLYNQDVKTQMVYTADSVYRIPLEVIDSVSFFAPQTIINKDVFPLTAAHDAYLSDADTVSFTLALNTPKDMIPTKGNIVVSEYDCTSFPYGIMARITSVDEDDSGIHFDGEQVTIDEVYEQAVFYGKCTARPESVTAQNTRVKQDDEPLAQTLWEIKHEKKIEKGGTTTNIEISDTATVTIMVRIGFGKPTFFQMELENALKSGIKFNAESSVDISHEVPIIKDFTVGRIPIPGTLFSINPKLSLTGYFKEEGEISLDFDAHYNRTDKITLTYANGEWTEPVYEYNNDAGIDVASLSMKGSAEIGVIPELFFSFCGTATGIGVNYSAGLKESIDFEFDAIEYFDRGAYDAMKDSYASTTIPQKFTVFAQAGIFDRKKSPKFERELVEKELKWGTDKYLLPEFSVPAYEFTDNSETSVVLSTDVTRDLLFPVNIGFALYDEYGNAVDSEYSSVSYQKESEWPLQGLQQELSGMEEGKMYTAFPLVEILGKTLIASPSRIISEPKVITERGAYLSFDGKQADICGEVNYVLDGMDIGFCINTAGNPNLENSTILRGIILPNNRFSATTMNLQENETYYYRAYVKLGDEIFYGETRPLVVFTGSINAKQTSCSASVSSVDFIFDATVSMSNSNSIINEYGICFPKYQSQSMANYWKIDANGTSSREFRLNIDRDSLDIDYDNYVAEREELCYLRAYVVHEDANGTKIYNYVYGAETSVKCVYDKKPNIYFTNISNVETRLIHEAGPNDERGDCYETIYTFSVEITGGVFADPEKGRTEFLTCSDGTGGSINFGHIGDFTRTMTHSFYHYSNVDEGIVYVYYGTTGKNGKILSSNCIVEERNSGNVYIR